MLFKVLVTGANGFIGRALCTELVTRGISVRGVTRTTCDLPVSVDQAVIGHIDGATDWTALLQGCDSVVHLAARVHVMQESTVEPLAEFRRVNVAGTLNLAKQAALVGVRRFIFISSIKVNGEATVMGAPFKADDTPYPLDAYGQSKMEAEQALLVLAAQTKMEIVIIRPPLVYGSGVKANFESMMRWLKRGLPLPLGGIDNRRSLVSLYNLVDLIITCVFHPRAAGQVFLVSDNEDVSTTELLIRMGRVMGVPVRLVGVPIFLLKLVATMLGKQAMVQRLCSSLQVDIEKTHSLLGWRPPITLSQGLKKIVDEK